MNIKAKEILVDGIISRTPSIAHHGRSASTMSVSQTNNMFRKAKQQQGKS